MLTQGVNIPEIDAVFLARPTRSEVLLTQMIGRGARKPPGKDSFFVVDFTDVGVNPEPLRADTDSAMAARRRGTRPRGSLRRSRPREHREGRTVQFDVLRSATDVAGLPFVRDQTFGVEIELTCPGPAPAHGSVRWNSVAQRIIDAISSGGARVDPRAHDHGHGQYDSWHVEADGSVGWEVVSPVLVNQDGFAELAQVMSDLDALVERDGELRIDHRAGLHLHLAADLAALPRQLAFLRRVQRLEPGLFTLVAPSRLYGRGGGAYDLRLRNPYCRPVREAYDAGRGRPRGREESRYMAVTTQTPSTGFKTFEVRMHSGTTNFRKAIPWISLWMQIFNTQRYAWRGDGQRGLVFPRRNLVVNSGRVVREDIFQLLLDEGISLPTPLLAAIWARRADLRPSWNLAIPRRVSAWEREGTPTSWGRLPVASCELLCWRRRTQRASVPWCCGPRPGRRGPPWRSSMSPHKSCTASLSRALELRSPSRSAQPARRPAHASGAALNGVLVAGSDGLTASADQHVEHGPIAIAEAAAPDLGRR